MSRLVGRVVPGAAGSRIVSALEPFVRDGTIAGAVTLVGDRDRILGIDKVGLADVQKRSPMREDTVFWIASQSKPITATAFMMLVDDGIVGLDDPVERHLPEFSEVWRAAERDADHVLLRRPRHPITIREILSHTSGMPYGSAMEKPTQDLLSLKDKAASYAMTPLDSEPGAAYQYSNAGINTAARIIETATGRSYEDFLDERLLGPLTMRDTTFWPNRRQEARLATCYRSAVAGAALEAIPISELRYPLHDHSRRPVPAGGLFSTVTDLSRLCRMILRGGELDGRRYLSEAAIREMSRRHTAPEEDGYALGWKVGEDRLGHDGAYATDMNIDRRRGLVSVFLVQKAGYPEPGLKIMPAFRPAVNEQYGRE